MFAGSDINYGAMLRTTFATSTMLARSPCHSVAMSQAVAAAVVVIAASVSTVSEHGADSL